MKKIIVFLILCFISFLYAGFSVINTGSITPSWHSTVVTGDFDNDGNLDLILTGFDSGSTKISKIYQGNGSGNFSEINSGSLIAVSRSSSVSGDIDGDGKLDLILAGSSSNGLVTKIYKNTGGANFIEINSNTLTAVSNGCMALGDIDSDGDLDLILTGQDSSLTFVSKIYQNDGTGSFTEINSGSLTGVGMGSSVVLEDLNGNGHLDLVINGQDSSSPSYYSGVYTNDGTGYFTEIQTLQGAAYGSLSSGDINNDGYVDIILSGSFCGEYGADYDKNITYVYINDGTGHMSQTGSLFHAGESSTAMGDINNDGSLDLVVLGWNGTDGATIYMYTNDGTGNFTDTGDSFFPVSEGSLLFGDFDNDKDLDLVITGNNTSRIYQNTPGTANTVPGVPTVTAFQDVGGFWKFTWDYPGDDHTPPNLMRYQFVIGTMSGTYNYLSSSIDYPRGQVSLGRGNHKQEYQTKIPTSQAIYVKIRAIDSAFAVGSYSAEFHSLGLTTIISNISLSVTPILDTTSSFTIQAKADSQVNIDSAYFYIGSTNASPITASAQDGAFDSGSETFTADLSPSGLGWNPGSLFKIYIKAKNTSGVWSVWTNTIIQVESASLPSEPSSFNHVQYTNHQVLMPQGTTWEQNATRNMCVITNAGLYKMWYNAYDSGNVACIGYAESSDGMVWNNRQKVMVADKPWETTSVYHPNVIYDASVNKFKMWYTGNASKQIGYATSSDGINWTKYASNPIMSPTDAWEINLVSDPFVMKEDGIYKMWYSGNDGSEYRIGYATSFDGIHWTKYSGNPLLSDLGGIGDAHVIKINNIYYIWYKTNGGFIYLAFSYDGIHWQKSSMNPVIIGRCPTVVETASNYRIWFVHGANNGSDGIYYGCVDFQGPSTTSLSLINNPSNKITTITNYTLHGFASDSNSGWMYLTEAECFVGSTPPNSSQFGTGYPLSAFNTGFNNYYSTEIQGNAPAEAFLGFTNGNYNIYVHARDISTNNAPNYGWGAFDALPITIDLPIPQPKFYCIDSIYGTTNYISSSNIQCIITNYDYADYYMISESSARPVTNLSAGWIPLSGGDKTTLVYTATNYVPNANSPIYLWIKADEIVAAMGRVKYVFLDTLGPDIGNNPTLNASASNSISITKPATPSDAGVGTMYWTVIRSNAGVTKTLATNLLSANNITDTGLTPNTFYYYKTIFLDQYKNSGASSVSTNIETLSAAPNLTFSRTLNVVNTNDNITMTNKSSDIAYYRYAYIQNSSYTVKIADSSWSNIALNSITNIVFPNEENWWIHVLSYNHQGVAGYQSTFGPYRYFKEVLGNFGLQSSKDLVVNNGTDSVVIDNSAPLTNIYTGLPITDNHKFNINIISGTGVISGASISNGQYYCLSSGGNIHFNLSGTVINKVVIQVSAVDFPGMTANITILISPELEMNLAEPLKRILNPDDGDILQIYLPESRAGENIAIEIYDIKRQVLVYSDKKTYQAWKAIEWDLTTRKGKLLSDGVYGVILRGSNWTKELKFVISRWYK